MDPSGGWSCGFQIRRKADALQDRIGQRLKFRKARGTTGVEPDDEGMRDRADHDVREVQAKEEWIWLAPDQNIRPPTA